MLEQYIKKYITLLQDSADNAQVSITIPAPGVGWRNRILKADASYSSSTVSGNLSITNLAGGSAIKTIHGSGAFDFPDIYGMPTANTNQSIVVTLPAGGASITGIITVQYYKHLDVIGGEEFFNE